MQQPEDSSQITAAAKTAAPDISLGRITALYGLQGWLKVHSDTSPRDNIVRFKQWWLGRNGKWQQIKVLDGRPQGKTIVVRLEGIDTPEAASRLVGAQIAVKRADLPASKPGEYYWTDLLGMAVQTVDGGQIGSVARLFETGANDVLVVRDERAGSKAGAEVLVPWIMQSVITEVNMESQLITVDWDPDF
ncbi:MAG: ribosome maturation factor RimM [Granulosicoccus sp.]